MVDDPQPAAPAQPKRFCKDCRHCQGSDTGDIPLTPLCGRPEAVFLEEDVVTGRQKTQRATAYWFRRSEANTAGNVLACGPEARYFEPQEAT